MYKQVLQERGWYETRVSDVGSLSDSILGFGNDLGVPVKGRRSTQLVQRLVPIESSRAFPKSMSARYSTSAFPLHVDTAHWLTPCRYVVFGCADTGTSGRPTLLFDFNTLKLGGIEEDALLNAPFVVRNGRKSFYSGVLSKHRQFIRYDPGCMSPTNDLASTAAAFFSSSRVRDAVKSVTWEEGKIVIIDNWRLLHGRGASVSNGRERQLLRVLVS